MTNRLCCMILMALVIILSGCGGNNSPNVEYHAEITARLAIYGANPGRWELLVYKQGHAGDKNYMIAGSPIVYEEFPETYDTIGSFKVPIPEPGIYDIDLKGYTHGVMDGNFPMVYRSWKDHRVDAPSTDLGTIRLDFPVP